MTEEESPLLDMNNEEFKSFIRRMKEIINEKREAEQEGGEPSEAEPSNTKNENQ